MRANKISKEYFSLYMDVFEPYQPIENSMPGGSVHTVPKLSIGNFSTIQSIASSCLFTLAFLFPFQYSPWNISTKGELRGLYPHLSDLHFPCSFIAGCGLKKKKNVYLHIQEPLWLGCKLEYLEKKILQQVFL